MLDTYHWQKEEEYFLGIIETGAFSVQDIRDLSWDQFKDTYEGFFCKGTLLELREPLLEGFREMLNSGQGLYDEPINNGKGQFPVFTKESLKGVARELDQFKDK